MNILVCAGTAQGHNIPMLPVIQALFEAGHQLYCVGSVQLETQIKQYINSFLPIPDQLVGELFRNPKVAEMLGQNSPQGILTPGHIDTLTSSLLNLAEQLIPEVEKFVERINIDLVYMDFFSLFGIPLAKKHKIPIVVSYASIPMPQSMINQLNSNNDKALIDKLDKILGTESNGQTNVFSCQYADMIVTYVSPQLSLEVDQLQHPNIKFTANNKTMKFQPIMKTISDDSLIYVSLGTLFNQNMPFFQSVITYFQQCHKYQVIISAGGNQKLFDQISSIQKSDNVTVQLWVNQQEMLEKAIIFVTHAGLNGVRESIVAGTPMLLFPQSADQPFVAKRITDLQAGIAIYDPSIDTFKQGFETLLDKYQQYHQNLIKLQESLLQTPTLPEVVKDIEKLVHNRQELN